MLQGGISSSNLYYAAQCLRKTGSIEAAIEYYKKALAVPVRNQVDSKGYAASQKFLLSHGYATESELDAITPRRNK
jgi:hypothetical protein